MSRLRQRLDDLAVGGTPVVGPSRLVPAEMHRDAGLDNSFWPYEAQPEASEDDGAPPAHRAQSHTPTGMSATDVFVAFEQPDSDLATGLLRRYYEELDARLPEGFDVNLTVAAPAAELVAPLGAFLVAYLDDAAVGCGALRKLDEATGEIKRMWVDPNVRGHGVGRHLLRELEDTAGRLGCRVIRLDTSAHLLEALALYRSAGYCDVPAYNVNRYASHWLEKRIS